MFAGDQERAFTIREDHSRKPGPRHILAGLQAGVVGAIVMVGCLMIGSLWEGRSVWVAPNLFATTFFGIDVYRNEFLRASWTGIALIIAVYGILGAVWGPIWRSESRKWLRLYGALAGLGVYILIYQSLSRHINPFFTLYAPDRQLEVGHILWGIVLARSPLYARRIKKSTSPAPGPPLLPPAFSDGSHENGHQETGPLEIGPRVVGPQDSASQDFDGETAISRGEVIL